MAKVRPAHPVGNRRVVERRHRAWCARHWQSPLTPTKAACPNTSLNAATFGARPRSSITAWASCSANWVNPNLHDIPANLPFRVELWDRHDQDIRWVIAASSSVAIGHAALDTPIANYPDQRSTLATASKSSASTSLVSRRAGDNMFEGRPFLTTARLPHQLSYSD